MIQSITLGRVPTYLAGVRSLSLHTRRDLPRSSNAKSTQVSSWKFSQSRWLSTEAQTSTVGRTSRWAMVKQRFREKKALMMVEYGSTFIFLHEFFGIMSYVTVFSLIKLGVIPVESILGFFGWTEEELLTRFKIDIHGTFTSGAMTYAVVKGLDALGLIPLRWFLTITLTPRVAWWLGPRVDRAVAAVKRLVGRGKESNTNAASTVAAATATTDTKSGQADVKNDTETKL